MINVLFAARQARWPLYQDHLATAFKTQGLDVNLSQDHPPSEVDYIIYAPDSPLKDFTPFTGCKAVLSLWAGVEAITGNETLTQPLCRMVDPGLSKGMRDWVTGHVLRYHLDIDHWIGAQTGDWIPQAAPLAQNRKVTILGLGALGQTCATALAALDFNVTGWARRPKSIQGLRCLHGQAGLKAALTFADILVLLLPNTPQTENLLNRERLAMLPKGARIINPGRGPLIDDDALLEALNTGQIAHATLDVFRQEPLPKTHPFWAHPQVTVTPHIAAETRPETASGVVAENIKRCETGQPLLYQVDRATGY